MALVQTVRMESQRLAQAPMELVRARQAALVKVSAARVGMGRREAVRRRKVGMSHDVDDDLLRNDFTRSVCIFAMFNLSDEARSKARQNHGTPPIYHILYAL
jgi:hypothetical protein